MSAKTSSYAFDQLQPKYQKQEIERLKRKTNILASVDQAAWQQAGLGPGYRVLDLGCGTGSVTQRLAEAVYPGNVIGVDISDQMLQKARTDYIGNNLSFEKADAYQMTFPDACFDLVHARFLFQHLKSPNQALREIYRILKPGGSLCVIDVDDAWFSLYPEPDSIAPFRRQMLSIQKEQGGDPNVGRKLFSYLCCAGFCEVKNHIRILGTENCGTQTLMSLLSFGAPYYADYPEFAEIARQAKQDVEKAMQTIDVWASLGLFTATGRKRQN
ncbi:MAG: class I SAM-dependent methyltransferase [Cyanobacteria bacterium J06632_3]